MGAIETDGVDLHLAGDIAQIAAGKLSLDWQSTLLVDYRVQETPGAAFIQEAGTFPSLVDAGSLTRYKSTLTACYTTSRGSLDWSVRYIGSARVLDADARTPFRPCPASSITM